LLLARMVEQPLRQQQQARAFVPDQIADKLLLRR
jgi:hypothetical protein